MARKKGLHAFRNNMRVRVISGPLKGKLGDVVRLCMSSYAAWVRMDDDLPEDLKSFDSDDPRARHIRLEPNDCEEVHSAS